MSETENCSAVNNVHIMTRQKNEFTLKLFTSKTIVCVTEVLIGLIVELCA